MTLYEIDKELMSAFDAAVDAETGEIINDDAYADFCQLDMDRNEKIENIGLWIKDLKADAEALKVEEHNLADRRREKENKVECLSRYLTYALDGQKFETAKLKVGYRKSQQVEVDMDILPDEYFRFRDPEPDKTKIKAALKAGTEIPGAELVEKQNMIIK